MQILSSCVYHIYIYIYISADPGLSLSQAGAAPGTTLGVQLGPLPTAPSMQQIPAVGTPNCFKGLQAYTACPPLNFLNPLHRPSRSQDTPVQLVFKAAVCTALNPLNPLNPPNSHRAPQASLASSSSQGHSPFNSTNSSGWHAQLFLKVFKPIVCPPLNFSLKNGKPLDQGGLDRLDNQK